MQQSPILVILLLVPAAGSLIGAFLPVAVARAWALVVSLLTAVVGIWLVSAFDCSAPGIQLRCIVGSLPALNASFSLGIDAISFWLVLLTILLMPLAIAASFESIKDRAREYYAWMLLLEAAMLGVFVARDILVFYVFFELTLVPMFFIIGVWGGPERRYAAGKFFLFTFTGSVLTLAGVLYLGLQAHTFDISEMTRFAQNNLTQVERGWILLAMLAGFAVKVPIVPVHTWLPLAHTEAPTAGSVILAGVLLKLGTYGLLRLAVPIGLLRTAVAMSPNNYNGAVAFPNAITVMAYLCLAGIIGAALVAWVQQDIKKLVAYSSVSHLGFCVLGLIALEPWGISGSVLYMINHGLSTGAMFLVIGMIYDRYHTRDINQLSGLARKMPIMAFFFIFFTLASIGLPGLNGFVSEFLTILAAFTSQFLGTWFGTFAALGIILGAIYMLHMAARVIWGPLKTPFDDGHGDHGHEPHDTGEHAGGAPHVSPLPTDIGAREISILIPLALACLYLGVYPGPMLRSIESAVQEIRQPLTDTELQASAVKTVPKIAGPMLSMAKNANLVDQSAITLPHQMLGEIR